MNIKNLRKNKKGFTLIEIIVVVVILAVLMAVAVPSVLKYMGEADDAKYMSTARGAYITAQAELAKAYTDGKNAPTYETALENAADEVNKGVDSTTKNHVTSIAPMVGDAPLGNHADPATVTTYVIVFQGKKTATLTPNGSVTIAATTTAGS